jgi:hypothetical protein
MFHGRRVYALGILLVFVAAAGCGGKTAKVEGRVTLDGVAVEGAMVSFVPENNTGDRQATGLTDADGVFQLTTFNTGDGAIPGTYKVTVEKKPSQGPAAGTGAPPDPEAMRKAMEDFSRNAQKDRDKNKVAKSSLPEDYAKVATTPLKYTIPYSGQIKIELKSKGGI